MPVDYKKIEFTLHEILVQIEDAYELMEFDPALLEKIAECKELVKTRRYKIAVMGEFKRGKSSLINALLGLKILPADVTPTTATINRITYAPTPKTTIAYKDGSVEEIKIDELSEYVTKLTASGEHRASKIKEATIYYPTVICQNYVDIIDTPGLNDEARMTEITLDMLDYVDAVIVPIHARAPFSETEKQFVCQLIACENIQNIVFVLTFIDQLFEDDEYTEEFVNKIKNRIQTEVFSELEKTDADEAVLKKAHAFLDDIWLYGVSASMALKSFISNNRSDLKKSGFEIFKNELLHIVTAKQVENMVTKSAAQICSIVENRAQQNQDKIAFFNGELEEMEKSFRFISSYCTTAHKYMDRLFCECDAPLDTIIKRLFSAKNHAMSQFIKALSKIRLNTHAEIEKNLLSAADEVRQYITQECLLSIKTDILHSLEKAMTPWVGFRQTSLRPCLENFDYPAEAYGVLAQQMLLFVKDAFSNLAFSWCVPIFPNNEDLSQCNVIEHITYAVDFSINALKLKFDNFLKDMRKNWFEQVKCEADELQHFVDAAYAKKQTLLDRSLKAFLHNYQVFDAAAEDIINRCNQIKNDILGGV